MISHIDIVVKPKSKVRKENEDETLTIHNPIVYHEWYEPSIVQLKDIAKYDEEIEELKNKINDLNVFKDNMPQILDDLEQDILTEVETRFQ